MLAAAERARQEEQRRVAEERALAEAAEQADKKKAVEGERCRRFLQFLRCHCVRVVVFLLVVLIVLRMVVV